MSSKELQVVEACDSDDTLFSGQVPMMMMTPDESYVLQNQNGRSRGEPELQKKLNKLRSIKLAKSPSRRRSKRRSNDATADDPQNSGRVLIRRSSFKPVNNLTRMSSVKFKSSLVRQSSGGTQLNKYRSLSSSSSPNFLKETCCFSEKRTQIQGSPHCSSESSCNSTPNSVHKSARLSKAKSKIRVVRKQSEISEFPDLGVQRATCSSALKHCKSPPQVKDVRPEGSESEGASATKPCPFTYCSLHGHRHANVPPLQRLISIRRRLLKTQKGTIQATQSPERAKKSSKMKEDAPTLMVINRNDEVHGTISPVRRKLGSEELLHDLAETCSKEDEDNYDLSDDPEKLFHETLEESLKDTSDLTTVVQHDLGLPTSLSDLCLEGCCIGTASEVTNSDLKEEKCAASGLNDGGDFISTDKMKISSPKPIPVDVESDDCTTVKLPDEVVKPTTDNENHENNCASGCVAPMEQIIALELKHGSLVTDKNGNVESDKNESAECSMQAKNNKYISMWKLMYKHAVKGNSAAVGNYLPLHGEVKEYQVEGTSGALETNNPSFPESIDHRVSTNSSEGDQVLELCQKNAIDIVQEAFDKILLPEVLDSSYDDESVTSDINSNEEGLQLSNDEGEERRILTLGDYSDDRMVHNAEETQLEAANYDAPKEKAAEYNSEQNMPKHWSSLKKFILLKRFVKAIEKVKNFSYRKPNYLPLDPDPEAENINLRRLAIEDKKSADEWMLDYALQKVISKLPPSQQRRVALLVEAFETVLPFPDITTHQRSNAIHSIGADLQACNGLLIQNAHETGEESDSGTSARILLGGMSCPEENLPVNMDKLASPMKSSMLEESNTGNGSTKIAVDIPASGDTDEEQQGTHASFKTDGEDKVFTINNGTEFPNVSSSGSKGPHFCKETSLKHEEYGSTNYEVLENRTVREFAAEYMTVGSLNSDVEISDGETAALNNNNRSGAESDLSEAMVISLAPIIMTARERSNGSSPPEESHSGSNADVTHVTQLEKQNYTRLWYFVYKHMVSSIAEKDGGEQRDEADEEEGKNTEKLPCTEMDPKLSLTNEHPDNKNNELRRIETVKLVEKAIDEILLPESQDESEDEQADTRNFIPDQEPAVNKVCIEGKSFATLSKFSGGSFRGSKTKAGEDPEQILLNSNNAVIGDEVKEVLMVEKPKQKMSKNWRNLKKMILLNRFIKALEKGKKSDPRRPKNMLLEPDPEAEKVNLKHQNIDERKNAEEWMLDYALQKAVAKLTPARSRKVALLVEAFETVLPNNGIPNPFKPEVIR
ncbi:calmodulin binding protein PICBP-like [Argentina anserina]|uniref:calmodulin binding protein PICBP-like n=1 Tax=Argentina anserina TaxID=57926 RepID=UPI0021765D9C|nr:calmodulin binding protein PICBP-like [Potentilla anserina]XP_050380952.1 calmodulin binding protein PICBP-like [Potentilla anserina]